MISGVNTGFGGSANTRTGEVEKLQGILISFLNCGILTSSADTTPEDEKTLASACFSVGALPNEDPAMSTFMPEF